MSRFFLSMTCMAFTCGVFAEDGNHHSSQQDLSFLKPASSEPASGALLKQNLIADDEGSYENEDQTTHSSQTPYKQQFSVYGDFLYWQPAVSDTFYGIKQNSPSNGEDYFFNFDWDVGFRIGAQYRLPWEEVSIDISWTCFHTVSTDSHEDQSLFNAPFGSFPRYTLYELPFVAFSFGNPWKVSASYDVKFDQIDLVFSKPTYCSKTFLISPFGGVRGLIVDYSLNATRYSTNYGSALTTTSGPFNTSELNVTDHMRAVGLVGGLNSYLNLGMGFSFFFGGDFFIGYGSDDADYNSFDTFQGVQQSSNVHTLSTNKMKTMFDMNTGFNWQKSFLDNHLGVLLGLGYEFHVINNAPTYSYQQAGVDQSDTSHLEPPKTTSFQGLVVRAGIGF